MSYYRHGGGTTPPLTYLKQQTMNNFQNIEIDFATATPAQLEAAGFTFKRVRGTKGKRNTLQGTRFNGKTSNLR